MKKIKRLFGWLVFLMIAGTLTWWGYNYWANYTVYLEPDSLALKTFVVDDQPTDSGLLYVSFKKPAPAVKYLNVLLGGRWIVNNMPVNFDEGTDYAYSFFITSLAVSEFDVEVFLSDGLITGQVWETGLPEAEHLKKLVRLEVVNTAEISCQPEVAGALGQPQSGTGQLLAYVFTELKSQDYGSRNNCLSIPAEARGYVLEGQSDESIYSTISQALTNGAKVWLAGYNGQPGTGSQSHILGVVGSQQSGTNNYLQVIDPGLGESVTSFRLESGGLRAYPWSKDPLLLRTAFIGQ